MVLKVGTVAKTNPKKIAHIDGTDTYLVIARKTQSKTNININIQGDKAMKNSAVVAAPFPPFNSLQKSK